MRGQWGLDVLSEGGPETSLSHNKTAWHFPYELPERGPETSQADRTSPGWSSLPLSADIHLSVLNISYDRMWGGGQVEMGT